MDQYLFGRALAPAEGAVTVRARDGAAQVDERSVPGSEAFLDAYAVIECADLDAALAPITPPRTPYLLLGWVGRAAEETIHIPAVTAGVEGWRRALDERGSYVMGSSFGGIEPAATMRLRAPRALAADSPLIDVAGDLATIDVIAADDLRAAIDVAATHPLATDHALEVRAFAA